MPETIVTVSVDGVSGLIEEGEALQALSPSNFVGQTGMTTVYDFAAQLQPFELRLLAEALKHALESEHDATVTFVTETMSYETNALGFEIRDTAVSGGGGPLTLVFILPGQTAS